MTFTITEQQTQLGSKVMSIGAITSPCLNNTQQATITITSPATLPSKPVEYLLPPLSQHIISSPYSNYYATAAASHRVRSSNRDSGIVDTIHTGGRQQQDSVSSKRMRLASEGAATITSSPSFSSSSSDHESDSNSNCSQSSPIFHKNLYPTTMLSSTAVTPWIDSCNKSNIYNNNRDIYAREALATESLLSDFDLEAFNANHSRLASFDYCDISSIHGESSNGYHNKVEKSSSCGVRRKADALATRRARNKLASAKYRAKKQALTHAMQDRIMQLATQVMSLRDELSHTRKNETEVLARYERLVKHLNMSSQQKIMN